MSQLNVTAWFSLQAWWELNVTAECHSLVLSASKHGGELNVTAWFSLQAWRELNVTAECHSLVLSASMGGS
jgi:hypothetical protein